MSDEKKTIKLKTTVQYIRFRGEGNSRPFNDTNIEEKELPSSSLDQIDDSKISFGDLVENKISLDEPLKKEISLSSSEDKVDLLQGNDIQSLNHDDINSILDTQNKNNNKIINVPFIKRSKNPENNTEKKEVKIDYSKRFTLEKKDNKDIDLLSQDSSDEITRQSFKKDVSKKSTSSWGQSSFGNKNKKTTKNPDIIEEESNGIFRTSSLKKPKRKSKEVVDEEGYTRSSTKTSKTFNNNKKEYIYNEEKLYNYGINRLSEQDYGRHELFKKMRNLQEDESIINKVLDKLESQKFLNDDNRIRSFLLSYSNSESVNKTKQRLMQKGFNKKEIERVLEDMEDSGIYKAIQDKETEEDKALNILIRKYRIYEVEKREKMTRFLATKGFSFDIITKVMKTFSNGEFDCFDPY